LDAGKAFEVVDCVVVVGIVFVVVVVVDFDFVCVVVVGAVVVLVVVDVDCLFVGCSVATNQYMPIQSADKTLRLKQQN